MSTEVPADMLVVGKITGVHGIKGWLKVHSYTDPMNNLFDYKPWYLASPKGWQKIKIDAYRAQGKGFVVHVPGFDDRDEVKVFTQRDIAIARDLLPQLTEDEYYWHQLVGLQVINQQQQLLGVVKELFETGANDVVVVSPTSQSIDKDERLIPYLEGQVIKSVDIEQNTLFIDWQDDY